MYFEDLSPYQYMLAVPLPRVFNVGWLSGEQAYNTAPTDEHFQKKLIEVFLSHDPFDPEVNLFRAEAYPCAVCGAKDVHLELNGRRKLLGCSEIWIPGKAGRYFAAPSLLPHYVLVHGYAPPVEYIHAVMDVDLCMPYSAEDLRYEMLLELKAQGSS